MPTCECPSQPTAAAAALACLHQPFRASQCVHEESSAGAALLVGMRCMEAAEPASRGFFVVSRSAAGAAVCTGGDSYHAALETKDAQLHFTALSQPVGRAAPNAYWINASATGLLAGRRPYHLSLSLAETVRRGQQLAERRSGFEMSMRDWLRDRVCSWEAVPLPSGRVQVISAQPLPSRALRRCSAVPPAHELAYASVPTSGADACGGWCTGDAAARIFNTSNEKRLASRLRQGFHHVPVTSAGCRFHWHDEAELSRCLAGKQLLLVGSAVAIDLQRGFAQINSSLAAWTRVRPGPQHPNAADFWRAFLKEGGTYCYRRRMCAVRFGAAEVSMRYPAIRGGLGGVLRDSDSGGGGGGGGDGAASPSARQLQQRMCAADVVVFEAGTADLRLPLAANATARADGKRRRLRGRVASKRHAPAEAALVAACEGRTARECDEALGDGGASSDWRVGPLVPHQRRLARLLRMWGECRKQRGAGWRAIYKLAYAPPPRARPATAASAPRDCSWLDGGYAAQPQHIHALNEATRAAVEAAGFEVFDAFGPTLHAPPAWFDSGSGLNERVRQVQGAVDPTLWARRFKRRQRWHLPEALGRGSRACGCSCGPPRGPRRRVLTPLPVSYPQE